MAITAPPNVPMTTNQRENKPHATTSLKTATSTTTATTNTTAAAEESTGMETTTSGGEHYDDYMQDAWIILVSICECFGLLASCIYYMIKAYHYWCKWGRRTCRCKICKCLYCMCPRLGRVNEHESSPLTRQQHSGRRPPKAADCLPTQSAQSPLSAPLIHLAAESGGWTDAEL